MVHFRLEAVLDCSTNRYSLEVYYPAESTIPFARTSPRFLTEAEAYEYFKKKFSEVFPDK